MKYVGLSKQVCLLLVYIFSYCNICDDIIEDCFIIPRYRVCHNYDDVAVSIGHKASADA